MLLVKHAPLNYYNHVERLNEKDLEIYIKRGGGKNYVLGIANKKSEKLEIKI